jgi:hypothetical protein
MASSFARSIVTLALSCSAVSSQGHEFTSERESEMGQDARVYARFDLATPAGGPFPSDIFTVEDFSHVTGRRLAYPYPDCTLQRSDCDDLAVVNTLDGWGLQTRVSIPFAGDIDPSSVSSESIFVVRLGHAPSGTPERIGINQSVWDVATQTLHFEVDQLLEQHVRYAVIVTDKLRDTLGRKIKETAAFRHYNGAAPRWYAALLDEALRAADASGVAAGHVVSASVFTTQTITSVMERIRDDIKAGTPAPADFLLGPNGERTVFNRSDVASVVFRQQTAAHPTGFTNMPVNLAQLNAVPGAVGVIAYGRYTSPDYMVHPGEFIPAVGTKSGTPPVQGHSTVYFTLYLPSAAKPASGWPVVIVGGGASGNQHVSSTIMASVMASHGLATIAISHVGQGFGPLGRLLITKSDATVLDVPDAGRGVDQNGDNVYAFLEGSEAAAPRTWTISLRDSHRQTVIDLMQLVKVIEVGMDVDGDSAGDLDSSRVYFQGSSAGPLLGTSFVALDPSVSVAAFSTAPGLIPEHARWQPIRRSAIGAALQARTPSLVNAPGLVAIDGVPTAAPHFNENKPLRDQPIVVNTIAGATAIQQALEFAEVAAEAGIGPVPWARHLRRNPLPGSYPKSILCQIALGDQQATNPGTSAIVREGALLDRTVLYRHDLAFAADPTIPKNPHLFAGQPTSPNATVRAISLGAQEQMAVFFASHGTTVIVPNPQQYFEVPIVSLLPETLNFIQ